MTNPNNRPPKYTRCNKCGIDAWCIEVNCSLIAGWYVCGRCMQQLEDRTKDKQAINAAKAKNEKLFESRDRHRYKYLRSLYETT